MKNWLSTQLAKIKIKHRWTMLLFVQIWVWPQILDPQMPAGIGFSTFITMAICVIFNFIKLVTSYEQDR